MLATKRGKPLYERGGFQLVRRRDRKYLQIVWYEQDRGRERSTSAGTIHPEAGRAALDRVYLERVGGEHICPTCGQRRQTEAKFVTSAIADYLTLSSEKSSIEAIRARLDHVLTYLVRTSQEALKCDGVNEAWIEHFRKWLAKTPIVSKTGKRRKRALSTIENSVLQLAAAINACGGGTAAKFKPKQPKAVNRTPQHRSDVAELARMFRYCLYPDAGKQPAERARRDRGGLLAFLRISVCTLARPDAAHDVSTVTDRRQWNSTARVLSLNPDGRQQTRKYRAVVPVPTRLAAMLDATTGFFVSAISVESSWKTMARSLNLPADGQSGMKLIRRSVAHILRQRLRQTDWGEIEIFLGHDRFDDVSDLYAPLRPDYLARALDEIERLIVEIDAVVPGAFSAPICED